MCGQSYNSVFIRLGIIALHHSVISTSLIDETSYGVMTEQPIPYKNSSVYTPSTGELGAKCK